MNRRLTAFLAVVLLGVPIPPAPAASLSHLVEQVPQVDPGAGLRAGLAGLLGGAPAPTDCFSPVLLAASQRDRWEAPAGVGPLARPPALPEERSWHSPRGPFRYFFTTFAGSPHALAPPAGERYASPPGYVEHLDEALNAAVELLAETGLRPPEGNPWLDVYLADPGSGLSGYTVPGERLGATFEEDRDGFLVLSPRLQDPFPAAAHQLTHLALLRYSFREPAWWHEATAAWVGVLAAGDAGGELAALRAHLSRPEDGLGADDLAAMRGALLFAAFVDMAGPASGGVAAIWEECAALNGDNLLPALDAAARGSGRGSLRDLLRAYYASWVADAAGRSRLMASLGIELPEPTTSEEVASYPAAGQPGGGPVAPLGAAFLHFASQDLPGGLSLAFEGESAGTWDTLLLVRSSPQSPFLAVPMAVDGAGRSHVRYPWGNVSDSVLLAVNLAERGEAARLNYWALHGDTIPFDLIELSADSTGDGVAVRWSTDGETDLLGWNVYGGSRPGIGLRRVNATLIPAAGGDRTPASYLFLDDTARGRKVYYTVEAVTVDGFVQRTHVIGARLPAGG